MHMSTFFKCRTSVGSSYKTVPRRKAIPVIELLQVSTVINTHLPVEAFPVENHPLVRRLVEGVFNLRPPQPHYRVMWDVSQLLLHIKSLGNTDSLPIKQLSRKLVVLLALTLANRSSDLVRLSLKGKRYSRGSIVLFCEGLTKQARPGRFRPEKVIVAPFEEDILCPVACLEAYESAHWITDQLFLGLVAPRKPVTSSSVARWVKEMLKKAGLGEDFGAHSIPQAPLQQQQ